MAGDAFLKLDGLSGISTDSKHPNWIELTSFGFSVSNSDDALKKQAEKTKGPSLNPVNLGKKVDKTSPSLAYAACEGSTYTKATIALCCTGGRWITTGGLNSYMEYVLENVSIDHYSVNGGSGYATETINLRYTSIQWCFTNGNITKKWDTTEKK